MPQRIKKMFATITKSDKNGPVFRFFMDLGDAGIIYNTFMHFSFSIINLSARQKILYSWITIALGTISCINPSKQLLPIGFFEQG